MHQPSKWWTGLIPVAALWIASGTFVTDPVESDILSRARDVAASLSPDTAAALKTSVAGRDVRVEGPEFAKGQGAAIARAIAEATGVRLVAARFDPVAAASPYVFSATRSGDQFILKGGVPSPVMRARLMEAAKSAAPKADIVDALNYATGAPQSFDAIALRGLGEAAKLEGGTFSLSDKTYSIAGEAATSAIYEAAIAATQKLPAGAVLGTVGVLAPEAKPFVWSATTDGVATTLSGVAPSIETRTAIARAATSLLPGRMIVDQMGIARGAPTGDFAAATAYALNELGRLAKGRVAIVDGAYTINGEATSTQAYEAAIAAARNLPAGFRIGGAHVDVAPPGPAIAPAQCQPLFNGLLDKGKILFETGSANLSKESLAVLDHLVDLAGRCRDADIEVAGHTDSVGSPDSNLELSRRRAAAVVAYLDDAGIETTRIASQGYGQTKPIASNDTAEGRAQNRRIEFLVK